MSVILTCLHRVRTHYPLQRAAYQYYNLLSPLEKPSGLQPGRPEAAVISLQGKRLSHPGPWCQDVGRQPYWRMVGPSPTFLFSSFVLNGTMSPGLLVPSLIAKHLKAASQCHSQGPKGKVSCHIQTNEGLR